MIRLELREDVFKQHYANNLKTKTKNNYNILRNRIIVELEPKKDLGTCFFLPV